MKKKKIMRGLLSKLIFVAAVISFIYGVYATISEGIDSDLITGFVVCLLYFAVYFILPLIFKPVEDIGPAVPEKNEILTIPASLMIVRESSVNGVLVPYSILLNGQEVCQIKDNQSVNIQIPTRKNILLIGNAAVPNFSVGGKAPKVRCEFEASDGASGEIHIKACVFLSDAPSWNA